MGRTAASPSPSSMPRHCSRASSPSPPKILDCQLSASPCSSASGLPSPCCAASLLQSPFALHLDPPGKAPTGHTSPPRPPKPSTCAGRLPGEQEHPLLPQPSPAAVSWAHPHTGCPPAQGTCRGQPLPTQQLLSHTETFPLAPQLQALCTAGQGQRAVHVPEKGLAERTEKWVSL